MRILLMSANTGGGHNAAALALKAEFEKHGNQCEMRDALSFVSGLHSGLVSSGHTYLYRYFPQLFGIGYQFEERHPPRFIYDQIALGAKHFYSFLCQSSFDAIVCTHLFGNMLVTETRKRFSVSLPHYLVLTDYTVYPGAEMVDVQRYFIADERLRALFVDAGIAPDRLSVSGIPVRSDFLRQYDVAATRQSLHLPLNKQIVLLFSGSIGCGRLHRVAPKLESKLPENAHLVIICGHNKRMCEQLRDRCGPQTTILGFTDRIAEYMAVADLCISKPGGLSITEMLNLRLPMVLVLTVPGCESHNMAFFAKHNMAIATLNWDEALSQTAELLSDPSRLLSMRQNIEQFNYPGGAAIVVREVMKDCQLLGAK